MAATLEPSPQVRTGWMSMIAIHTEGVETLVSGPWTDLLMMVKLIFHHNKYGVLLRVLQLINSLNWDHKIYKF